MFIKKLLVCSLLFSLCGLIFLSSSASALDTISTEGGTAFSSLGNQSDGAYQLTGSFARLNINFTQVLTFKELLNLSVDYKIINTDPLALRYDSPRFEIYFTDATHMSIYMYPDTEGNFRTTDQWVNTDNLIGSNEERFNVLNPDLGYIKKAFYPEALSINGDKQISSIALVVDNPYVTVLIDNLIINDTLYNFEPDSYSIPVTKDDCLKGGYSGYAVNFKNQGQCIKSLVSQSL